MDSLQIVELCLEHLQTDVVGRTSCQIVPRTKPFWMNDILVGMMHTSFTEWTKDGCDIREILLGLFGMLYRKCLYNITDTKSKFCSSSNNKNNSYMNTYLVQSNAIHNYRSSYLRVLVKFAQHVVE